MPSKHGSKPCTLFWGKYKNWDYLLKSYAIGGGVTLQTFGQLHPKEIINSKVREQTRQNTHLCTEEIDQLDRLSKDFKSMI